MKIELFDFELPRELIADRPVSPRDASRLLRISANLSDHQARDLPKLLKAGDILVFNDTRVIPARLKGTRRAERGTAKVEVTLLSPQADGAWTVLAKPAKRLRAGDMIDFGGNFEARVESREDAQARLRFDLGGDDLLKILETQGAMPLPPYMGREGDARDLIDYQTVYADQAGAVAAPTAGLHFTDDLLDRLDDAGIERALVTLHVGAGTFLPVTAEDTDDHRMHAERGRIDERTAEAINRARNNGGRVIAIGTTSLRLLESAAGESGEIRPWSGETDIFITPGYRFRAIDLLLSNFHLPRSTLFMLVSALAGRERMLEAYTHARENGYRFYSYGDCCLIERAEP